MSDSKYFVGKGKVFIGTRFPDGTPDKLEWLGNVPALAIATKEDTLDHKESYSGLNLRDKQISIAQSATATFTLEEFTQANLQKFLSGEGSTITGNTVANEPHHAHKGAYFQLNHGNLDNTTPVVLTSSGGSPTTFFAGSDFTVDHKSGMIFVPATSAIVDGTLVLADYEYLGMKQVGAFTTPKKEWYLYFGGLNLSDDSSPVLVDIFKFKPMSPSNLSFIGDEFLSLEISGEVLFDSSHAQTYPADGGFFKVRQVEA